MGYFLGIKIKDLPDYPGLLANALIPVADSTTEELFKIKASDVLVGGSPVMMKITAIGGATETIVALHGKVVCFAFRGFNLAGFTITTGTPTAQEVKWDNSTDELTAPNGNDWLPGENIYIQYIN